MTYEFLKKVFNGPLPGESAHAFFSPMRGSTQDAIRNGAPFKNSAVAIILFHDDSGELSTIVTQRRVYNGSHSGQISFPGGKAEETDSDLTATAIRECWEEIGIDISEFEQLGILSQVYIPVSLFLIEPCVFYSSNTTFNYQPSEREVASIYEISLPNLFQKEAITLKTISIPNGGTLENVPHFHQNGIFIWGATALLLSELKALLTD